MTFLGRQKAADPLRGRIGPRANWGVRGRQSSVSQVFSKIQPSCSVASRVVAAWVNRLNLLTEFGTIRTEYNALGPTLVLDDFGPSICRQRWVLSVSVAKRR